MSAARRQVHDIVDPWRRAAASCGHGDARGRVALLRQVALTDGSVDEGLGVADALDCLRRLEQGRGNAGDMEQADWTLEARLGEALALIELGSLSLARPLRG